MTIKQQAQIFTEELNSYEGYLVRAQHYGAPFPTSEIFQRGVVRARIQHRRLARVYAPNAAGVISEHATYLLLGVEGRPMYVFERVGVVVGGTVIHEWRQRTYMGAVDLVADLPRLYLQFKPRAAKPARVLAS